MSTMTAEPLQVVDPAVAVARTRPRNSPAETISQNAVDGLAGAEEDAP